MHSSSPVATRVLAQVYFAQSRTQIARTHIARPGPKSCPNRVQFNKLFLPSETFNTVSVQPMSEKNRSSRAASVLAFKALGVMDRSRIVY